MVSSLFRFVYCLGEGVDPRGGVESRSDLPDLKSSKVDFDVDFLTKVEEKSGTRL